MIGEYTETHGTKDRKVDLIRCPACEVDLRGKRASFHIASHDPEDFGLAPLGTIDPDYLPSCTRQTPGAEKQSTLATFGGARP
jgi:hypothetical protein